MTEKHEAKHHEEKKNVKGKFDLQAIMENVKSLINPVAIPESSKDNPVPYLLGEISKAVKTAADLHSKQADAFAKLDALVGELYTQLQVAKSDKAEEK